MSPARGMTNGRRFDRKPKFLPRLKVPVYDPDELAEAIRKAADFNMDGWVHTKEVAHELGVSQATAYRYLCDAAARGWIETREMYRWVYTKSVLSRHWRGREMFVPKAEPRPAESQPASDGGQR